MRRRSQNLRPACAEVRYAISRLGLDVVQSEIPKPGESIQRRPVFTVQHSVVAGVFVQACESCD
jgi:hypothetical protein